MKFVDTYKKLLVKYKQSLPTFLARQLFFLL